MPTKHAKAFPPDVVAKAHAMWLAGARVAEIAYECRCSCHAVAKWRVELDWPRRKKRRQYEAEPEMTEAELEERKAAVRAMRINAERHDGPRCEIGGIRQYTFANGHFEGVG